MTTPDKEPVKDQRIPVYGCKAGQILRTPGGSKIIEGDAGGILLSYIDTMDAIRQDERAERDGLKAKLMAECRRVGAIASQVSGLAAQARDVARGATAVEEACRAVAKAALRDETQLGDEAVVNPTEPGIYPVWIDVGDGAECDCALWDGKTWSLWVDAFDPPEWDAVANLNCRVMRWTTPDRSLAPAGDGWIACADRMPEIGQRVLVSQPYERVEIGSYGPPPDGFSYPADHPHIWWVRGQSDHVTHWAPLPPGLR